MQGDRPPQIYWHYTCQHGRDGIGDSGVLEPRAFAVVWLTDLADVDRDALGLTSRVLACDRTRYRYRVLDAQTVVPYTTVRRNLLSRLMREELEASPGAMPMHWYVSTEPVAVRYWPHGCPIAHEFLPVAGHPDDDECTYRPDGTDATYCGEPASAHD